MSGRRGLAVGKLPPARLDRSVLAFPGLPRRDVLIGPRVGVDVGAVRLSSERVGVFTTDPLYVEGVLGWRRGCWFAFHILANDLTTTGHPPSHILLNLNLPVGFPEARLRALMEVWDGESRALGASILGGHTGAYPGLGGAILGSATFFAAVPKGSFAATPYIRDGAVLLLSKSAGLEAAVLLAHLLPRSAVPTGARSALSRVRGRWKELSSVKDALSAARVGLGARGVQGMHDVAEGGLLGALAEMAMASGRNLKVDLDRAPVEPDVRRLLSGLGLDPRAVSGQGALLVAVRPDRAEQVLEEWSSLGIRGSVLGSFSGRGGKVFDRGRKLGRPPPDRWYEVLPQASPTRSPDRG